MPKVLVVDDEESLRTLLRTNLEGHGYEVEEAENGADALDKIAQDPPDLVLLDTMMPEVDGFDVLEQLRGVARYRNLPVLMLTAKTAEDDRVRAFTAGANDFVPKPFYIGELLARVQRAITTAARQRQLVAMSTTDPITGLFNNRYLDSRLRHTFPASGSRPVCGLLFELTGLDTVVRRNGFKAANDIMGSAGDIVNAWVSDDDQAFAIGGSQILVLSAGNEDEILGRGAELQNEVHQVCHFTPGGQGITVHLSFVGSEDGETVESFLYRLETALQDARGIDEEPYEESLEEFPPEEEREIKETLELAAAPGIGPHVEVGSEEDGFVEEEAPEPAIAQPAEVQPGFEEVAFSEETGEVAVGAGVGGGAEAAPPPVATAAPANIAAPVEQPAAAMPIQPVQPQVPAAMEGSAWEKAASMELDAASLPAPPDADELFAQTIAGARERGEEDEGAEDGEGGEKPKRTARQTLSMRMLSREFSGLRDLGKS